MWGPNQTSSGPPMPPLEGGSKRGNEFRVVERVAYAHPVRDHHVYYAPKGGSQYEQRPPPPLPPPHNNQVQQQQQSVGYPFYGGSNSNAGGGGHQRQQQEQNSGRARVRRGEHNSECVLYDPSESVVIDYVDGASASGPPRLRSRGQPQQPPALPPSKSAKPCIHKQHRTHPAPVAYSSELGSSSEVTLGPSNNTNHLHQTSRQQHQHHHHVHQVHSHQHHSHRVHHHHQAVYMPGGHVDVQYLNNHHVQQKPPSSRGSHSSDTSSAYSGSDTMQSLHSGCENDTPDLTGLHESIVDSDEEDLTHSMDSLNVRDNVRDSLEKDPVDRTNQDLDILMEFTQKLEAFNQMTEAVRRALCSVMVFAVVEKAGTTVMMHGEELDSWSVIINGEVRIDIPGSTTSPKLLRCGDSFGITPTMDKLYHQGVMKTVQDDCQFVCITQSDYYKILNDGEANQKVIKENDQVVLVSEFDNTTKTGFKVIRGTPEKLLDQLVDENFTAETKYDEDFLLTHRTFMPSFRVMEFLLKLMKQEKLMDRVTRLLLLWVHNHFLDFETNSKMMEYLEEFETLLGPNEKSGKLRLLIFACAEKAKQRTLILTRPSKDEPLHFTLMGGHERGFGIFVEKVEQGTKAAEIGLKRGDQILKVNGTNFEHSMTLEKAILSFKSSAFLEIVVKSNLLVFKEMLHTPESSRNRLRKGSDVIGTNKNSNVHTLGGPPNHPTLPNKTGIGTTGPLSGRARIKQMMVNMMKPKNPISESGANLGFDSVVGDAIDAMGMECPEHALKIYKSNQDFKFLLVHPETSAKNVVMLALQEFGITELSSNYSLCEVTVKNGCVMQRRQPEAQTNLAEKIGLASRYYIKNNMASDQLITDDAKTELVKESQVHLLDLNPMETAAQIMVEDFTIFRQIEMTEYIDHLFDREDQSCYGCPNLKKFGALCDEEMKWVITEIVTEPKLDKRVKIMKQFIKIAHHCFKDTQNFNSMFAITAGLTHSSVQRLKNTKDRLSPKYKKLLDDMTSYMDPTRNFSKYRNLISNSSPPMIPIYPMVSKDLTFIHLGNKTKVDNMINFEKLRMLAKEIRGLMSMCSASLDIFTMMEARQGAEISQPMRTLNSKKTSGTMGRHASTTSMKQKNKDLNPKRMHEEAQMVRRVKAYLSQKRVIVSEDELMQLSQKIEPDPQSNNKLLSSHPSTTSITSNQSNSLPPKRMPSPSPSNGSTTSSTSLVSEGRKSTTSGGNAQAAKKFGTDSPQAMRKLMSLSEPGKVTRQRRAKHSVSSLHSMNSNSSPPASPPTNPKKVKGHERSQSDSTVAQPVSLSAESSSVTSVPAPRKHSNNQTGGAKSKIQNQNHKIRLARTISREPEVKESSVDDDDDGQVSAV